MFGSLANLGGGLISGGLNRLTSMFSYQRLVDSTTDPVKVKMFESQGKIMKLLYESSMAMSDMIISSLSIIPKVGAGNLVNSIG